MQELSSEREMRNRMDEKERTKKHLSHSSWLWGEEVKQWCWWHGTCPQLSETRSAWWLLTTDGKSLWQWLWGRLSCSNDTYNRVVPCSSTNLFVGCRAQLAAACCCCWLRSVKNVFSFIICCILVNNYFELSLAEKQQSCAACKKFFWTNNLIQLRIIFSGSA